MRCQSCGMENPKGMRFCGGCGAVLETPAVVGGNLGRARQCVACGRSIEWDAKICMYCGHDYQTKAKPGTEGYLITGAVMTVLAGLLGIIILMLILDASHDLDTSGKVLEVVSLSCAVLGVAGGFAAMVKRWFPLAVLGAVCAIFTPAFFFAIPGLVLIVRSATSFADFARKD